MHKKVALRPRKPKKRKPEDEKPIALAHIQYVRGTTGKIGKVVKKH